MKKLLIVAICAGVTLAASAHPARAEQSLCNGSSYHFNLGGEGPMCSEFGADNLCQQIAVAFGCTRGTPWYNEDGGGCGDFGNGAWADCTLTMD
jgi:hypothetical protein